MDATLQALGDLLIKAVPTIFLFILVTVYLKYIFFRPVARILEERKRATAGVRELARQAFEAAGKKEAEFERALQIARAELHREHESLRREWTAEQEKSIAEAHEEAERQIEAVRRQIAQEAERAQAELNASVEGLSEQIANSLLVRRAA